MGPRIIQTGRPYPHNAALAVDLPRNPDERVLATMHAIHAMVDESRSMPFVVQLAGVVRTAAEFEPFGDGIPAEVRALFKLLRRRVVFRRDPVGTEFVRSPDQPAKAILDGETPAIDCDCLTALGASLSRVLEHRVSLIVMGTEPSPAPFRHIYWAVRVGDRVIPMDPQEVTRVGAELPAARKLRMDL